MLLTANNLSQEIAELQREGKLPAGLSARQIALLKAALQKYSGEVSQRLLEKILQDFKSKIQSAESMTEPDEIRGIVADLTKFVGSPELAETIRFGLDVSQQVSSGAGRFMNQNLSPEAVDEYPALELKRMFRRNVPRGFKAGPKGVIIEVPDEDWPSRWVAAGGKLINGRMVALKDDPIWQRLGDGVGGYGDTLGNPFPPFAFNSGFMTFEISRKEAVSLGLLNEGEEAKPARIDFGKLFAPIRSMKTSRHLTPALSPFDPSAPVKRGEGEWLSGFSK